MFHAYNTVAHSHNTLWLHEGVQTTPSQRKYLRRWVRGGCDDLTVVPDGHDGHEAAEGAGFPGIFYSTCAPGGGIWLVVKEEEPLEAQYAPCHPCRGCYECTGEMT